MMNNNSRVKNVIKNIEVIVLTLVFIFSPFLHPQKTSAAGSYLVPQITTFNASGLTAGFYPIVTSIGGLGGSEAAVQFYVSKAGTFSGMSGLVTAANASGDSTFTFRKNGANGNQTFTVPQSTTGLIKDTTNTDHVSVGDLVNMQLTYSAGTIQMASVTIFFQADDGTTTQFVMAKGSLVFGVNLATRYQYITGGLVNGTVEANTQIMMQHNATISDMAVYVSANARTSTNTFRIRKNGANGNNNVSYTSGQTGLKRYSSTADTFSAGDLINYTYATGGGGGGPAITIENYQLTMTSTNAREMTVMSAGDIQRASSTGPLFVKSVGTTGVNTGTETSQRAWFGRNANFSGMAIRVTSNTSNRNMDLWFRISGADGTNKVTNTAGTTGWLQDTTNTDPVTDSQYILWRSITNPNTAGTGNVTYSSFSIKATFPDITVEQSAYRFFNNTDSADIGSALSSQDTAATLGATGNAFRLRLLLHISNANLGISGENFKLQFAEKSGTCDTSFSGETYADVTTGTLIAYNDNNTPSDGDNLTSNANDPTHNADTITNQDYEESNNFTNSVSSIPAGQDGKWDFSLIDNGATANTSYCFRIVKSDGSTLNTYTVIPEITTAAGGALSVDIVDAGGVSVPTPSVDMSGINFSFANQASTGVFGISSEKIRVDNGTGTATWTLSLAADGGAASIWDGTTNDYDFNDPTANANDGGDADSFGGQMTLDPSGATITPEGGCTLTNISAGSSTPFSQGVTDSVTLASATTGADTGCYWDITNIDILQSIPAEQPADNYAIDMTLSIIAS